MKFSQKNKKRTSRTMQIILLAMLGSGLYTGNPKVITNAGIGLAVTFLPGILKKKADIVLNPFLTLWITSAVFFHALGSYGFYGAIWWWDHLTHALSATVVTAIGYTVVRSIDIHSEEVNLPPKFISVFLLMTVIAFGVIWELFEYGLDILAETTQISMPLAQHGLEDTMKDMMFNTAGAVIVAASGQAYLSERTAEILESIKNEA